jgi:DNA-binding transcriptional ArsR family regulator
MFNDPEQRKFGNTEFTFYIGRMARLIHPNLNDVPVESVLHALADPTRLAIVRALNQNRSAKNEGLACNCTAPDIPRATLSHHFSILRGAGLIEGRKQGTMVIHRLRRTEVDARFPGLLDAVLRGGQGLNRHGSRGGVGGRR